MVLLPEDMSLFMEVNIGIDVSFPGAGWLKQKCVNSLFWRLQVQVQGVPGVSFFTRLWEENRSYIFGLNFDHSLSVSKIFPNCIRDLAYF